MRVLDRLAAARTWLLLILSGVVVALLPWTAFLTATLPARHLARHWDLAWAGLDVFEAAAIATTAIALVRRSTWLAVPATAAGTALLGDAWFDLITASPGDELRWSLLALFAELPLAALCFWIAFDSSHALASAARASAAGPRPTASQAPPAGGRADARTRGSAAPSAGRTSR